jgi:hypothetical protein
MSELTEEEKKLTAFSLFSMGMKIGPPSFERIENIIKKLDLGDEFAYYAHDWITHAQEHKKKTELKATATFIEGQMINKIKEGNDTGQSNTGNNEQD